MDPRPVTLAGRRVRMEPLDLERHFEGLVAIGLEPGEGLCPAAGLTQKVVLQEIIHGAGNFLLLGGLLLGRQGTVALLFGEQTLPFLILFRARRA